MTGRTPPITRIAAALLGIASSPVVLAAAAWIRIVDGAPAVHPSTRIGRHGAPFVMYKLRTLCHRRPGDHWPDTVISNDGRLLPGARWLRAHKIDELPQLWNIVLGDMTFVGPRPELPSAMALYEPRDYRTLDVLPGLTDLASLELFDLAASVESMRGEGEGPDAAYRRLVERRRMMLRHRYLDGRSGRLDALILLRTAHLVMVGSAGSQRQRRRRGDGASERKPAGGG